MIPTFTRIIDTGTALYAEIFWLRGELGAPCHQWWDLAMCEFRLRSAPDQTYAEVYATALTALRAAITSKSK